MRVEGTLHEDGITFTTSRSLMLVVNTRPSSYGYTVSSAIETNDGTLIIVPPGFTTDFASVPRLFWSIIPPVGKIAIPAIVHDYIYTVQPAGRKWADAVMFELMRKSGCNWLHCWTVWCVLRIFGRKAWRSK